MILFQPADKPLLRKRGTTRRPATSVVSVCCLVAACILGCGGHEPSPERLVTKPPPDVAPADRASLGASQPNRIALDAAAAAAWRSEHALRYELKGHTGSIEDLAISSDSRFAASCSADRTIRIWDLDSGAEVRRLEGHLSQVDCVAFSRDGRYLASGSQDNALRIWDLTTGTAVRVVTDLPERVVALEFGSGLFNAAFEDASTRSWNVKTGTEYSPQYPTGYHRRAQVCTFSTGGRSIYFSDRLSRGKLYTWDTTPQSTVILFGVRPGDVRSIATSSNDRFVAASYDARIDIFSVQKEGVVCSLKGHSGPVESLAFSPDGRILASASDDTMVNLWHPASGEIIRQFAGHTDSVRAVAYSPDGRLIVSGGLDTVVRVWNAPKDSDVADRLEMSLEDAPVLEQAIANPQDSGSATTSAGDSDVPTERVTAALARAKQLLHRVDWSRLEEFRQQLNYVAEAFPEVKVTIGKQNLRGEHGDSPPAPNQNANNQTHWQSATINTEGAGIGVVRFASPLNSPAEMYWALAPSDSSVEWHIACAEESMEGLPEPTFERNLDLPNVPLPDENVVYFQAFEGGKIQPGRHYYLIFKTDSVEPVELQLAIALVPDGGLRVENTPDDIARVIGLATPFRHKTSQFEFVPAEEALNSARFTSAEGVMPLAEIPDPNAPIFPACIVSGLAFLPHDGKWFAGNLPRSTALGTAGILDLAGGGSPELLAGHSGALSSVAASPDGRFLATAAHDGAVILRDGTTHEVLRTLRHQWPVHEILFSPDNSLLLAACGEYQRRGDVALWDPETGEFQGMLSGHDDAIRSLSFSADGFRLVTAAGLATDYSKRGTVVVWDFPNRRAKSTFVPFLRGVYRACLSADGRHVAVAGQETDEPGKTFSDWQSLRVMDTQSGAGDEPIFAQSSAIQALQFIDNDRALVSAGADGIVRLWNTDDPETFSNLRHAATWHLHEGPIVGIALSENATQLASVDAAGNLQVVDLKPEPPPSQVKIDLLQHRFATNITRLGFTRDGKRLFVGANGWGLSRWNVGETFTNDGLATSVPSQFTRDCDFSSDGDLAVLCTNIPGQAGERLSLFDMRASGFTQELSAPSSLIFAAAFSSDDKYLASGSFRGDIAIWDVATGAPVPNGQLHGHSRVMKSIAFSPDDSLLASGDNSGLTLIWSLEGGVGALTHSPEPRELPSSRAPIQWLDFTSDGSLLIVESDNVRVLDVSSGEELASFPGRGKRMGPTGQCTAISPDNRLIAVAAGGGAADDVRIYDIQTGKETTRIRNVESEAVWAVTFSPSGQRLITGGQFVQCWDVQTGRQVPNFSGL